MIFSPILINSVYLYESYVQVIVYLWNSYKTLAVQKLKVYDIECECECVCIFIRKNDYWSKNSIQIIQCLSSKFFIFFRNLYFLI